MTKLIVAFRNFVHVPKRKERNRSIHEYNFAVSYNYVLCLVITFRNVFVLKGKCEGRQNGIVCRIL